MRGTPTPSPGRGRSDPGPSAGGSAASSASLFRHPQGASSALTLAPAAGVDARRLPRRAGAAVRHVVLEAGPAHVQIVRDWGLQNFQTILHDAGLPDDHAPDGGDRRGRDGDRHRRSRSRSRTTPRGSRSRGSRVAILVAVVLPLWANYLVRVVRLADDPAPAAGRSSGCSSALGIHVRARQLAVAVWITFTYLWLPVRRPADLRGARAGARSRIWRPRATWARRAWTTFRRVILPLVVARASWRARSSPSRSRSATTSRPSSWGTRKFIGNVIYDNVGVAEQHPVRRRVRRWCRWRSWPSTCSIARKRSARSRRSRPMESRGARFVVRFGDRDRARCSSTSRSSSS